MRDCRLTRHPVKLLISMRQVLHGYEHGYRSKKCRENLVLSIENGGEGGIRTPDTLASMPLSSAVLSTTQPPLQAIGRSKHSALDVNDERAVCYPFATQSRLSATVYYVVKRPVKQHALHYSQKGVNQSLQANQPWPAPCKARAQLSTIGASALAARRSMGAHCWPPRERR